MVFRTPTTGPLSYEEVNNNFRELNALIESRLSLENGSEVAFIDDLAEFKNEIYAGLGESEIKFGITRLLIAPNDFIAQTINDNNVFDNIVSAENFVLNSLKLFIQNSPLFSENTNMCLFKFPNIYVSSSINDSENVSSDMQEFIINWEMGFSDKSKFNGDVLVYIGEQKTGFVEKATAINGAYIDTGLTLNYSYAFKATGLVTGTTGVMIGAYSSNSTRTTGRILPGSNKLQTQWASNIEISGGDNVVFSEKFTYLQKANEIYVYQKNKDIPDLSKTDIVGHKTSGVNNTPILLFLENETSTHAGVVTIYEAQILDNNENIIRHFKPFRIGGGSEIAMLDVAGVNSSNIELLFTEIDSAVKNGANITNIREHLTSANIDADLIQRIYVPTIGSLTL